MSVDQARATVDSMAKSAAKKRMWSWVQFSGYW
jgi:hypothetical protein